MASTHELAEGDTPQGEGTEAPEGSSVQHGGQHGEIGRAVSPLLQQPGELQLPQEAGGKEAPGR